MNQVLENAQIRENGWLDCRRLLSEWQVLGLTNDYTSVSEIEHAEPNVV